jgi:carbamoyl-phosphate synthase large subunit
LFSASSEASFPHFFFSSTLPFSGELLSMGQETRFLKKLKTSRAYLHFEDGARFDGYLNWESTDPRLAKGIWGEAAFTTGMSGYQETITDPSFLGQHIIFTTSHVGNYPADPRAMQSKKSHATAVIARHFSHNNFLENLAIPLMSRLDTRA